MNGIEPISIIQIDNNLTKKQRKLARMKRNIVTICFCSISSDGTTHLHLRKENAESPKIYPFTLNHGGDLRVIDKGIESLVKGCGVESFTVSRTPHPKIFLVRISEAEKNLSWRGDTAVIAKKEAGRALEAMTRHDTLLEGQEGIKALREALERLKTAA